MSILETIAPERKDQNETAPAIACSGYPKRSIGDTSLSQEEREAILSKYMTPDKWDSIEAFKEAAASMHVPPGSTGNADEKTSAAGGSIVQIMAAGRFDDMLDGIQGAWTPGRLDDYVNKFLRALSSEPTLTNIQFDEYIGRLTKKLKNFGYTPSTPSTYRKLVKNYLKLTVLERAASRKAKAEASGKSAPARFTAVGKDTPGASSNPADWGILDRERNGGEMLTNFTIELDEDIVVRDDFENQRMFVGRMTILGKTLPFRIKAEDFADNHRLKPEIYRIGGLEVQIHCEMNQLRTAISAISSGVGKTIRRRDVTNNFGWMTDEAELNRQTYLVPSGRITDRGFEKCDDSTSSIRVDLGDQDQARYLDMQALAEDELKRVKQHLVDDFLPLHDRRVTFGLFAASAAAVLQPFVPGVERFAMWLVGLTGAGKSFAAKLAMNFFGDFPAESGRFATWSSTTNYIQRQGYFFKDAMYLVDDYKPEIVQNWQIVRIMQTYSGGGARGRLNSDATAKTSRPIRGLLVCTGEDVPEHNASAMARSVVIKVPQQEKDLVRGRRCVSEARNYSGVMADFIRWLIAGARSTKFTDRVTELQRRYYSDVKGQQNDSRIATNLALLGAAFEQMAEYFGDVWGDWAVETKRFVEEDLLAIRDEMLGEVKEQQTSEIFLRTLADLIRFNHVRIDGLRDQGQDAIHKPVIGKVAGVRRGQFGGTVPGVDQGRLEICTSIAWMEVNRCLQSQSRSPLKGSESMLLRQLAESGKLLDASGQPMKGGNLTHRVRLDGSKQKYVFAIRKAELLGDDREIALNVVA